MRRIATWLLVGAVAALGFAAAVDALRGNVETVRELQPQPPPTTTTVPGLTGQSGPAAARLRDARVTGVLTYADADCRLSALSLPDLEPVRAPSFEMCRPLTDSGGLGAVDGNVVWAGSGAGAMQVVVSREMLGREIRRLLDGPTAPRRGPFRAVQAVALGTERLVVLADSTADPAERVLVLVEDGRVIFVQPRWVVRDDVHMGVLKALPLGRVGVKRQWIVAHVKTAPLAEHDRAFIQLCHKWFPHVMMGSETQVSPETALAVHG